MKPADSRPLLALTAGDPAGIGPEIVARVLAEQRDLSSSTSSTVSSTVSITVSSTASSSVPMRILAIGPSACRPEGVPLFDPRSDPRALTDVAWLSSGDGHDWELGRPQVSAGRAALAALRTGHELALARRVDALVCAPVSKEALHLAGERVEGQTELLGRWAGTPVEMLGIARELRVLLLTRHVPLAEALARVTCERVLAHLLLLDQGLRQLGFARPRLALAGLNPHAGENGLLGGEEKERLEPAVARARTRGLDVTGPLSPDTVFLRAARGEFEGVLALYHDQAFIPLKLHAPGEGITVLFGLPYLRVSPAHGTAFDLAGSGRADPGNLRVALAAAARFAPGYSARSASART